MYGTNFVFFGRIYEKNYVMREVRVHSDSGLASVTAGCSLSDGAHDLKRRRSVVVYLPSTNTITLVVATTSRCK